VENIHALTDRSGSWQETTELVDKLKPHDARMGELLPSRHRHQSVPSDRQLPSCAVAPVVALQAQGQATQGRVWASQCWVGHGSCLRIATRIADGTGYPDWTFALWWTVPRSPMALVGAPEAMHQHSCGKAPDVARNGACAAQAGSVCVMIAGATDDLGMEGEPGR
jgi:hypothetical protein